MFRTSRYIQNPKALNPYLRNSILLSAFPLRTKYNTNPPRFLHYTASLSLSSRRQSTLYHLYLSSEKASCYSSTSLARWCICISIPSRSLVCAYTYIYIYIQCVCQTSFHHCSVFASDQINSRADIQSLHDRTFKSARPKVIMYFRGAVVVERILYVHKRASCLKFAHGPANFFS